MPQLLKSQTTKAVLAAWLAAWCSMSSVSAGVIGSGAITGAFADSVPTIPLLDSFILPFSDDPAGPPARGGGTSFYEWGYVLSRVFFDGVEVNDDELNELAQTLPEDELIARLTQELVPSGNSLAFVGNSFVNQPKGQSFVGGTIEYSNAGSGGIAVPSVLLRLASTSADPDFVQQLDLPLTIVTTHNTSADPALNADYIYFTDHPEFGSFRVLEGESTSVEVLVSFNSLDLVGFGAVADPDAGFVSPSVQSSVPEPSSLCLWLSGMIGASLVARRSR